MRLWNELRVFRGCGSSVRRSCPVYPVAIQVDVLIRLTSHLHPEHGTADGGVAEREPRVYDANPPGAIERGGSQVAGGPFPKQGQISVGWQKASSKNPAFFEVTSVCHSLMTSRNSETSCGFVKTPDTTCLPEMTCAHQQMTLFWEWTRCWRP